ncbi:hypothetical protein AB0G32_11815 [Streptomyces sp. NPDC023723]|uniref:hypothetical protein n=1 Tax=Streptomyces sp. NPDC023723 TaxID=3154323 RepID=UPI0033E389FD
MADQSTTSSSRWTIKPSASCRSRSSEHQVLALISLSSMVNPGVKWLLLTAQQERPTGGSREPLHREGFDRHRPDHVKMPAASQQLRSINADQDG